MPQRKPQQHRLLQHFKENPDAALSIEEIAAQLECSVAAAKMTVYRLSQKGYVDIPRVVRLTPEARKALA